MMKNNIANSLKSLSEISKPDNRYPFSSAGLEDIHAALDQIVLYSKVPSEVRQLFETAKNLSLYSWFVYRFHQVSESVVFSALEMALRLRFIDENPDVKSPMLSGLLKHAQAEKWIENERFSNRQEHAFRNAQHKKFIELIESGKLDNKESVVVDEPTKEEIQQALEELDPVGGIVNSAHKLRNNLAHGSSTLHPGSISTLRVTAEIINQTYEGVG